MSFGHISNGIRTIKLGMELL